jgi:Anti-sigma factor NepR
VVSDKDKFPKDLNDAISKKLGDKLKQVYSDIASEPVPDRFIDLINQLEKQKKSQNEKDNTQDQDESP